MILVFRILTILIAVMMFGTAANWIIDPTAADASLRMDLLTGRGAVAYTHLTLPTTRFCGLTL